MTTVSRLAALSLGLGGCSNAVQIAPSRTAELVRAYSTSQETSVWYGGARYSIGPAQGPKLRVYAWPSEESAPSWSPLLLEAPLGSVRTEGHTLYFPGAVPVRTYELERSEVDIDGDAPARFEWSHGRQVARPLSERRHALGMQLGGSGFAQVYYRFRFFGPFLFELGVSLLPWPGPAVAGNTSFGFGFEVPISSRWSVYGTGGGGAGAIVSGESEDRVRYFYGRAGVAVRVGWERRDQIGVDGGIWDAHVVPHRHGEAWFVPGFFVLHTL